MKCHKRFLVILLLAAVWTTFAIMPSTVLGTEPAATIAKEKPAAKEISADKISVGGKSLQQWRAIFGTEQKQTDNDTIFSKPVVEPTIKQIDTPQPASSPLKMGATAGLSSSECQKPPRKHCWTSQQWHPNPQIRFFQRTASRQTAQSIVNTTQKTYWTRLAVIANNLANVDTVGYKRNRTLLVGADTLVTMQGNDWSKQGQLAAAGIGAADGGPGLEIQTDFRQGRLKNTGRMLDIAIEGRGFLQVLHSQTGQTYYTRAGNLSVSDQGALILGSVEKAWTIEPEINIPTNATSILVNAEGIVSVTLPSSTCTSQVGQLMLARFLNPAGLQRLGGKIFAETDASGNAIQANPGQESCGVIRQGHLECSNVDLDEELDDWNATAKRIKILGRMLAE